MPGKVLKDSAKVSAGTNKKVLKDRTKTKSVVPGKKSQLLNKYVLSALTAQKKAGGEPGKPSEILFELIKNIFVGDEVSVKDCYSTLVAYFVLNVNEVSYDVFSGTYESVKMSCEPKHSVCSALPYAGLIASGLILKWKPEQQNQVVFKMLKIYQTHPDCESIVFHFLLALDNVKLTEVKSKINTVKSLVHLYFLLNVDSKQDISTDDSFFSADNISDFIEVFIAESKDAEMHQKTSELMAKKLLTFGAEVLFKFWDKLMKLYEDCRNSQKEVIVLQLLSSLLINCKQDDFLLELDKLFTPCVVKILSKSSPKIEPVFKSINSSLKNLSNSLTGAVKLSIIEILLVNAPKYLEKSCVHRICEMLVGSMSFEEISHVVDLYKQIIMGEKHKSLTALKGDSYFNDFEKICCIRFFGKLISLSVCKDQVDWKKTHFKFLFKIGFLSEYNNTVDSHLAGVSRKTFFMFLNHKFAKLIDLDNILKKIVKTAGERVTESGEKFAVPFKKNAYELWFKTLNVLKNLKESESEDKLVFKVLLRYMMLFMFSNYPTARSMLEELFKVIEYKESKSNELHWTEVTIDMFLHLLSGNDNTHSNLVRSTFSHVCKHMSSKGLNLILAAVKGEDKDIEESSQLSDSGGSDEESVDSDDDDGEDEEESDDESSEENEGQIDKLKDALRQELYKIDTASTCGSIDLDDLDEEEGKQLNTSLGQIFKAQSGKFKSSETNKAKNLEMHFRIRAINLLEIYIENEPSLYNSTIIISSIISLLKTSISNHTLSPFVISLKKCLKKLTNLKQFSNTDYVTETSLCSTFNEILIRDCPPSVYQDMMEQIVDSCIFLIRSAGLVSEKNDEMSSCLKKVVNGFFKDVESHVPFLLFTSIYSSFALDKLLPLTNNLVKFAFSNEIKPHKRSQSLQLLVTFYNNNRLFKDVTTHQKPLIKLEEAIFNKSFDFICNVQQGDIHKKYGCMYLDLLALVKNKSKLFSSKPGSHLENLPKIINKLSTIKIFQNELKISFTNFCKICHHNVDETAPTSSPGKSKKRKIGSNGNNKEADPSKNKKKLKTKQKLQT